MGCCRGFHAAESHAENAARSPSRERLQDARHDLERANGQRQWNCLNIDTVSNLSDTFPNHYLDISVNNVLYIYFRIPKRNDQSFSICEKYFILLLKYVKLRTYLYNFVLNMRLHRLSFSCFRWQHSEVGISSLRPQIPKEPQELNTKVKGSVPHPGKSQRALMIMPVACRFS